MSDLLQYLKANQRTGSKPRCHQLTHGTPEKVAERLNGLLSGRGTVSATDHWMPRGCDDVTEAQLHKPNGLIGAESLRQKLLSWWLAVYTPHSVTPNWDIASTCTIGGEPGLLLVEAKAHHGELKQDDRCGAVDKGNFEQIGKAIRAANDGLNKIQEGWNLSHESHYQLCNRFAWSWKLATLGIPVVLVYLGFLEADEMRDPFPNEQSWGGAVRNYARGVVPDGVWGHVLDIEGVPIYPILHSKGMPLDRQSRESDVALPVAK